MESVREYLVVLSFLIAALVFAVIILWENTIHLKRRIGVLEITLTEAVTAGEEEKKNIYLRLNDQARQVHETDRVLIERMTASERGVNELTRIVLEGEMPLTLKRLQEQQQIISEGHAHFERLCNDRFRDMVDSAASVDETTANNSDALARLGGEMERVKVAVNTFNEYLQQASQNMTRVQEQINGNLQERTAWRSHSLQMMEKFENWIALQHDEQLRRCTKSAIQAYVEILELFRFARTFTTPDLDKAIEQSRVVETEVVQ